MPCAINAFEQQRKWSECHLEGCEVVSQKWIGGSGGGVKYRVSQKKRPFVFDRP